MEYKMTQKTDNPQQHGFKWLQSESIESLNITVEIYQHINTGALHYHLAADNDENVFLVALRTIPTDSTGVAHILEHTALCGSERYPVRDPFFMMIRRSLNTFMNAFTSSDWTAYPFASKNKKDFNNLLDVYLDAVFFSRLHELDFAQEGHRLEFSEKNNPQSELVFKGVVFNEMKGAMSSTMSSVWHTLTKYLFPSTTYHFNSGGEPSDIPDLSYEQLKSFYKIHYHPSNAVFLTYGNIAAVEHQQKFEKNVLSRFSKLDKEIRVENEKRYYAPVRVEEAYALDEALDEAELQVNEENNEVEKKSHLVMAWLLGPTTDLEQQLKAQLLSNVLLGNSASPLLHALETTDLGQSPSALCGLEDSNKEISFICGLEGAKIESATAFEKLVMQVLNEVMEKGVDQHLLDAVLHQLELSQREVGGDHYPFGLQLILSALPAAIHRGDVIASMDLDRVLNKIRQQVQQPGFIQSLVQEFLLDNLHFVRLAMYPDRELSKRRINAEKQRLAKISNELSIEEKQEIIEQTEKLEQRQQMEDDVSILPKVGLEDVPANISEETCDVFEKNGFKLNQYIQGTNGLCYQQIIIALPNLDEECRKVLPLFSYCMTELGCDNKSYIETQLWQSSVSGGISAFTSLRPQINNEQQVQSVFVLSGNALHRNFLALSELLKKTLTSIRFDEVEKIKEIIANIKAKKEHSITGNGHVLAMLAASSGLSPLNLYQHNTEGMEGVRILKQLDSELCKLESEEKSLKDLCDKFYRIHHALLKSTKQFLLVTEKEVRETQNAQLYQLWSEDMFACQGDTFTHDLLKFEQNRKQVHQAWLASTQVNFCAKSYPTVTASHKDAAGLMVLAGFLRNGYLHRAIRENGGAYGGGASQDNANACFKFYSYRDPRFEETLNDFDQSLIWLKNTKHDYQALEEAILGVISSLDKPISPAGEAKKTFYNNLFGRDLKQRIELRKRILAVKIEDLIDVVERYFQADQASVAVITNESSSDICDKLKLEKFTV